MRAARRGDQGAHHDSSSDSGSPAAGRLSSPTAKHLGAVGPTSDPPLPEGWKKLYSRTKGREYYQNIYTGKSQWHPPTIDSPGERAAPAEEAAPGPLRAHEQRGEDGGHEAGTGRSAATIRMQQDAVPDEASQGWRMRALQAEARVNSLSVEIRYADWAIARA